MSSLGKRVRMGATLAVAAAGLLWLHTLLSVGVLSLAVVSVLALLSAWELDRMGSFRGRKLGTARYRLKRTLADMRYQCTAARRDLGWEPRVSFNEGIGRAYQTSTEAL